MNINCIEYSIATRSLDIFFAGCNNRCEDCFNPHLMSFSNGTEASLWLSKIEHYLKEYKSLINRILLVGGSPNHQPSEDLEVFLKSLGSMLPSDIDLYAFCGEELSGVNEVLKKYCDYIKCGAYIPSLTCDNNIQYGIKLATSNQKIYKKGTDY